ncbi:hypothetical protein HMPREF3157_07155 [Dermabacter sp. HMSC06F07]|uniref:DUF3000 domain-containing protein n=1 Tax=Dermabacter TaxID=36739 RepID=UPI0008A257E1|nr:DUF3000 domain-containing protein [Dermabacter sp. HMSC06F07]MCT1806909.1 DUF3000 domain-containing protein [Dermabacter hominis]OFT45092.1 hypothetical protein HMPREF3157_07155 [Dermabacter sp. HMSC06F07]
MAIHHFPQEREEFVSAIDALTAAPIRHEVKWEEIPAPSRLAPFSWAAEADVVMHDADLASGKFIVLYDPEGREDWSGRARIVTLMQAQLEHEFALESMLGDVAWSWVTESLELAGTEAHELGCTVTRVVSQSYGSLAARPTTVDIEMRASWSPDSLDLGAHFGAWSAILCAAGGLPPQPLSVSPLHPSHRARAPHLSASKDH